MIRFILGPLRILGGLWFSALPFAFATLSDGDRDAPPVSGQPTTPLTIVASFSPVSVRL